MIEIAGGSSSGTALFHSLPSAGYGHGSGHPWSLLVSLCSLLDIRRGSQSSAPASCRPWVSPDSASATAPDFRVGHGNSSVSATAPASCRPRASTPVSASPPSASAPGVCPPRLSVHACVDLGLVRVGLGVPPPSRFGHTSSPSPLFRTSHQVSFSLPVGASCTMLHSLEDPMHETSHSPRSIRSHRKAGEDGSKEGRMETGRRDSSSGTGRISFLGSD